MKNNLKNLCLLVTLGFVCVVNGCEKPQTGVPVGLPVARQGSLKECFDEFHKAKIVMAKIEEVRFLLEPISYNHSLRYVLNDLMCFGSIVRYVDEVPHLLCGTKKPEVARSEVAKEVVKSIVSQAGAARVCVGKACVLARDTIARRASGSTSYDPSHVISIIEVYLQVVNVLIPLVVAVCAYIPFDGCEIEIGKTVAAARDIDQQLAEIQELRQCAGI